MTQLQWKTIVPGVQESTEFSTLNLFYRAGRVRDQDDHYHVVRLCRRSPGDKDILPITIVGVGDCLEDVKARAQEHFDHFLESLSRPMTDLSEGLRMIEEMIPGPVPSLLRGSERSAGKKNYQELTGEDLDPNSLADGPGLILSPVEITTTTAEDMATAVSQHRFDIQPIPNTEFFELDYYSEDITPCRSRNLDPKDVEWHPSVFETAQNTSLICLLLLSSRPDSFDLHPHQSGVLRLGEDSWTEHVRTVNKELSIRPKVGVGFHDGPNSFGITQPGIIELFLSVNDTHRWEYLYAHEARHIWQYQGNDAFREALAEKRRTWYFLASNGLRVTDSEWLDLLHDLLPEEIDADLYAIRRCGVCHSRFALSDSVMNNFMETLIERQRMTFCKKKRRWLGGIVL